MKYAALLVVVAIGAVSGSANTRAVTCDECQAAAAGLAEHLQEEESIGEQIEVLKQVVCPQVHKV